MTTEGQRRTLERLESNVAKAAARLARATERVEEARAAGVDTSTFDPRVSGQSADNALGRLADQLAARERELAAYQEKHKTD